MPSKSPRGFVVLASLVLILGAGCGDDRPMTRSPTPDEDPGRYARAVDASRSYLQQNEEAERRALGRSLVEAE